MKLIYIVILLIFYFLIKELLLKYFPYSNIFINQENFKNLSEIIFINNKSIYNKFPIKKQTTFENKYKPLILTDYKYSEVFKLGYELSKIFPMEIEHSSGMYNNLLNLAKDNTYQMSLCTENDYYRAINNKEIDKNDINFVCSFYRLDFLLILNAKYRINNFTELLRIINTRSRENESNYLKIGILNNKHGSHYDGIKLLELVKITKLTKGVKIIDNYETMRDLIEDFDKEKLDIIYLTSTSKNPFLINFLKTNFINIIGTDGINENLLNIKFPNMFRDTVNISKFNRIVEDTSDLLSYNSSRDLGKKTKINTYSTRLLLVAKKELPDEYVQKLLRNIYGSLRQLKKNMNDYFLNERNNILIKLFDPYEMFFIKEDLNYHPGAKKFYEEINFINYSEKQRPYDDNIHSKLLTEVVSTNELASIKKYDVLD